MKINRKQIIKKVLYCLALSGMIMETSCSINNSNETEEVIEDSTLDNNKAIDSEIKKLIEEIIIEEQTPKTDEFLVEHQEETNTTYYDEDSIEANSEIITTVRPTEDVWIRKDKNTESDKLGKLVEGREFPLIDESDPEWYQIEYYGDIGYVSKEYSTLGSKRIMNIPIIDKGYLTNSDILYTNKSMHIEKIELNKLEFVEIYKEYDNCYMVATIDDVGFIPKDNIELVSGNMAVVDESNQEIRIYEEFEDNICGKDILTLKAPIVTGTKNTEQESEKGFFTVWSKWSGPGYMRGAHYVDNATFYNHDDGFHDATSWMPLEKFGGNTYLNHGSMGCANMRLNESRYANKVIQKGDKVLVKK